MISMQNYFRDFNLLKSESLRALGVGGSLYIGLKTSKSAPNLSKVVMGSSSIAALYFGGLLEKEGLIRKYGGGGVKIPGLGNVKIGFSVNDIIDGANNTSKYAINRYRSFEKYFS